MEIINEANEKFKDRQDEVCGFLFDVLREFNAIEKAAFERSEVLRKEKEERGIPEYQESPEERAHWNDYKAKLKEIRPKYCTEKHLKRGFCASMGDPAKYAYIDDEECHCRANFIMKSAKRAEVITHFIESTLNKTHRFVLVNVDGKWLIDAVYRGYEDKPDKWSITEIC